MSKAAKLGNEYAELVKDAVVYLDGNFTVAFVETKDGKYKAVGCAKRNPNSDEYLVGRGVQIATARALENLDKMVHPRRYAKDTPAKAQKGTKKARKS